MRVTSVKKARKDQGSCGKCGVEIKRGDSYRWYKFRYGGKHVRCSDSACSPRPSELTSSDKLSRLYAAGEQFSDDVAAWDADASNAEGSMEELTSIAEAAAEEVREVGEEYRESAEAIREHIAESPTADECDEKADALEGVADELESLTLDDPPEREDFSNDDDFTDAVDQWASDCRDMCECIDFEVC